MLVPDTMTGGIHALASLASTDDHGFTLHWIDDRGGREFVYVALTGQDARSQAGRLVDRLRLPDGARRGG